MNASDLRKAIEVSEFSVCYQPRFSLETGAPRAAEALVRWGERRPGVFIPEMERNGNIRAVTMFVVQTVCAHIHRIQENLGCCPRISLNISPVLFCDKDFIANLRSIIAEQGIPPSMIELEITESAVAHDFLSVVKSAKIVREDGHDLALDDFGTGFSGLRYLDMIPASIIKLDRHFVGGLGKRKTCDVIVASVAHLASETGMITVAEGVENRAQLKAVTDLGYDEVQGFLMAKPMPFLEFVAFLSKHLPQKRAATTPQLHNCALVSC